MKIIKAGFSKTFPYQQFYEKIWLEAELNEGDDERNVLYELKKTAENFFYESKGAAEKMKVYNEGVEVDAHYDQKTGVVTIPKTAETKASPKSQEETIIEGINSCQELKVLESYRLIAQNNVSGKIKEAYETKLQSLKK